MTPVDFWKRFSRNNGIVVERELGIRIFLFTNTELFRRELSETGL